MIRLRIDDTPVEAQPGETILEAAKRAGIRIPTLCFLESLSPGGVPDLPRGDPELERPACARLRDPGPRGPRRRRPLRKAHRPPADDPRAPLCRAEPHLRVLRLQRPLRAPGPRDRAWDGPRHLPVPVPGPPRGREPPQVRPRPQPVRPVRPLRPGVRRGRGGVHLGLLRPGVETLVEPDLGGPWAKSQTCTGCGKCVQACPVGALFEKGKATSEQVKRPEILAEVTERRPRA